MRLPRSRFAVLATALLTFGALAGCVGSAKDPVDPASGPTSPTSPTDPSPIVGNETGNSTSGLPVDVVAFKGTSQGGGSGAASCLDAGQTNSAVVPVEQNGTSLRLEVKFKPAGVTGDNTLAINVRNETGTLLGEKTGKNPVVLDLTAKELGSAKSLRIIAFVCDGVSTSQPWEGVASFFNGTIPAKYTALAP